MSLVWLSLGLELAYLTLYDNVRTKRRYLKCRIPVLPSFVGCLALYRKNVHRGAR